MSQVIYLEPDKRPAILGEALGNLLGNYLNKRNDQDASKKVQQIWDDQSKSETDRILQIQQEVGHRGMSLLGNVLETQYKSGEIGRQKAATDSSAASTAETKQRTQIQADNAPLDIGLKKQELQDNALKIQKMGVDVARSKADLAKAPDEARKARLDADLAQQEYAKNDLALNMSRSRMQLLKAGQNPLSLDGVPDEVWNSLPAAVKGAASLDVQAGDIKGAASKIQQEAMRDRPKAISDQSEKVVAGAATVANSAKDVLDSIETSSKGGPLAGLKGYLVGKGYSTGDLDFDRNLAATHQQLVSGVQAGGGFGGSWKVKLIHDTSPNVQQSPMFRVIETNMILKDRMSELQREKQRFEGTEYGTKSIDETISQLQPLLDKTESLKQYVDPKTSKQDVYYNGDMVDPRTLKPILKDALDPDQKFVIKGQPVVGGAVNRRAIELGVSPSQYLQALNEK